MDNPLLPDGFAWMPLLAIGVYLGIVVVAIYIAYRIIRLAVARGLRDHQLWMEKYRSGAPTVPTDPTARRF